MNNKEYYDILELNENCTINDIKKSYRKLSLKWHPDRNNNSTESNEIFKSITNAYNYLINNKNTQNDLIKNDNIQNDNINLEHFNYKNIFSLFENLSNIPKNNDLNNILSDMVIISNNLKNSLKIPEPILKDIYIDIIDIYNGIILPIEISRNIISNSLNYKETEKIYLKIQKGTDHKEIIIIKNKGNIIDNNKGDIHFIINIINNTYFIRDGLDIIYNKEITLKDALCGFSFEIQHINGSILKINNLNGNVIKPNYKKIVNNMGFIRETYTGNLIIHFNIIFPNKIPNDKIDKFKELLNDI